MVAVSLSDSDRRTLYQGSLHERRQNHQMPPSSWVVMIGRPLCAPVIRRRCTDVWTPHPMNRVLFLLEKRSTPYPHRCNGYGCAAMEQLWGATYVPSTEFMHQAHRVCLRTLGADPSFGRLCRGSGNSRHQGRHGVRAKRFGGAMSGQHGASARR